MFLPPQTGHGALRDCGSGLTCFQDLSSVAVVVVAVKRQLPEGDLAHLQLGRSQPHEGLRELPVDRAPREAAHATNAGGIARSADAGATDQMANPGALLVFTCTGDGAAE